MKGRPVIFVPTKDPKRAARWYVAKLGMTLVAHEHYASVVRDRDVIVRLAWVEGMDPAPFTILGWEVRNLDAAMRDLKKKRVKFVRYEGMVQNKNAVWTSPSRARVAWFHDGDGNVLSLTQPAARSS